MEPTNPLDSADTPQIPSTQGLTTKVVKGSIWTLAGQVLPLGASFIATPFVIRLLGTEQYGVFGLINLVLTYLTFADFGMSLASTNFASEAYSKGSNEEEGKVVRTAALIALCSSAVISILVTLLANLIVVDFLKVPEHLQNTAIIGIYLVCVILMARVLSSIFNSPQLVRLRMDLNSAITATFNIGQIIVVPIVIYLGGGIIGAVITVVVAAVATLIAHIIVSGKLLKNLYDFSINPKAIKPLLSFGGMIVIISIAAILLANLEKVLLTRYTSVTVFAYYSVAFTLANMVTLFSASMAQSLLPAFSQLYTTGKKNELQDLYSRTLLLNLILFAPAAMLMCLIAQPFFTIWAGADFGRESTLPFYVLLGGLVFNFSATVSGSIIVASRNNKLLAILNWLELFPYLLLTIVLTYYWGAVGAALAWSIRVLFETVMLFLLVQKKIGLFFNLFEKKMFYLMVGLVCLLIPPLFDNLLKYHYVLTAIIAIVCLLLYGIIVWYYVFSTQEQNFLKDKLSGISRRFIIFR